jgi:hypothetical protein
MYRRVKRCGSDGWGYSMRIVKFLISFFILQLTIAQTVFSQHLSLTQYRGEFGLHVGTVTHKGDIAPDKKFYRPNFGFYYYKLLDKHLSVNFSYEYVPLGANDAGSSNVILQKRNFNYYRSFQEMAILWGYHFNPIETRVFKKPISPYINVGMGYLLNVPTDNNNFMFYKYDGEKLRDQIWPILTYPIAVGIQYPLQPSLSLFTEFDFRMTSSDAVDHFGSDFPVIIGAKTYTAPSNGYDYFYSFKVGLHYQWKKVL